MEANKQSFLLGCCQSRSQRVTEETVLWRRRKYLMGGESPKDRGSRCPDLDSTSKSAKENGAVAQS
ncbi:hypothetical protein TVAGG3_1091620, partial [Trichomonas vaginalis G3]|uniref:uncharacterized protein n=1 Tax=Trichomonas vaginalis (strain ATCC PRA-98 / G3) TaxID=412133 RepID=UPI0021569836